MKIKASTRTRGLLCGALAAATYGTNPLLALPLYDMGLNVDSVLFYRYGIAGVILAVIMWILRDSFKLSRSQIPQMMLYSVLFGLSSLLLYESYRFMDVGIASTILFVYPVFVAVINAAFYGERVSPLTIMSIAMALTGIGLLYGGGSHTDTTVSVTGTMLVIASALSYAIYMVAINHSSIRQLPSTTLTFYSATMGLVVFVVRMAFWTSLSPVTSSFAWICILGIAIVPTIVSLLTMAVAIHDVGSTPTAILGALEPLTAVVIGIFVFGERLTLAAAIGMILVIVAVTLLVVGAPLMRVLRQLMVPRIKKE